MRKRDEAERFEQMLGEELRAMVAVEPDAGFRARLRAAMPGAEGRAAKRSGWLWRGWAVGAVAAGVVAGVVIFGGRAGVVREPVRGGLRAEAGRAGAAAGYAGEETGPGQVQKGVSGGVGRGGIEAARQVVLEGRHRGLRKVRVAARTEVAVEVLPRRAVFPARAELGQGELALMRSGAVLAGAAGELRGRLEEDEMVVQPLEIAAIEIPEMQPERGLERKTKVQGEKP